MFKKISLVLVITLAMLTTSCEKKPTEMTFESQVHDFGTIKQGDKVVHDFKFTNTGGSDLIITDAKGSCGCTVPAYPKEPVKPGESGVIKVSFDSHGKSGEHSKSVTVFCNVEHGNKVLNIKANIEALLPTK
ncbi:DUF1573 domain-containing protein [Flavobacterium sp.]|uniref:DUF1573 domain-containing protein n=1 Tax=Flavobacterium sp. TaxID=239 RepID=UPI002FDE6977